MQKLLTKQNVGIQDLEEVLSILRYQDAEIFIPQIFFLLGRIDQSQRDNALGSFLENPTVQIFFQETQNFLEDSSEFNYKSFKFSLENILFCGSILVLFCVRVLFF